MKNNYFSRCVLLAGLCSVIMVFAVTPVYATGGAFSPLPHAVSETLLLPVKWLMMPENL